MIKILMLLTNAFLPDPRPQREAASLVKAGYGVKIICWDRGEGLPGNEVMDGVEIERVYVKSTHGRGTFQMFILPIVWFKMLCRLARIDFDIVWCHDFDSLPIGLAINVFRRKSVIFDSHEVYSKMLSANVAGPVKRIVRFLERTMVRRADHVIVTCPAMKVFYASLGTVRTTVIGNFKDPASFSENRDMLQDQKHRLGAKDELVICYIAAFGPDRIIKPLLDVVKEDNGLYLVIGGDGCQRAMVEGYAKECSRIKYLGYVPSDKVPLYTAISDVIYYGYDRKSEMAEFNCPNKLFEALAAGKAFIGGDFGQMGDIINAEHCGIALREFDRESVKNAIGVMKDRKMLRLYKDNAKKAGTEKYNWAVAEKAMIDMIARIEWDRSQK